MWKCVFGFNIFFLFFSLFIFSHFLKREKSQGSMVWARVGRGTQIRPLFLANLRSYKCAACFYVSLSMRLSSQYVYKNKIAQGDVSIFSHLTIFLDIAKFVIYGSELVEIDTLFALCRTFVFGGYFVIFSKMRFVITSKVINRFFWFQIANTGWSLTFMSLILKKIGAKLRPWECPNRTKAIMAAMTSSNLNFQNRRKTDLANS